MDNSRPNGASNGGMSYGREMTRAERFDDEKRRLIDSCFMKKDEDGSIMETYITHIKITEFSTHPTTPPPPQARTPQVEKPRVIAVAVRKSGRVRMHKTKENANGTFSIGKTWNLDDLSAIESFTASSTPPDYRQWAGDVGFTVTLGKPYYWQAQTDKEKKFFIASLIKIYGKYTAGRVPVLTGFDPAELEQVVGSAQRRPGQPQLQQFSPQPATNASPMPNRSPAPERSERIQPQERQPYAGRSAFPDRGTAQEQVSPQNAMSTASSSYGRERPDYSRPPPRGPLRQDGASSPSASVNSSRSANQDALRRLAGGNVSQDSVAGRSDDGSISTTRSRERPMNGATSASAVTEQSPRDERPPERRRPPVEASRQPVLSQGMTDESLMPAPLMRRDREPTVPPRSVARKPSVASRSETSSLYDRSAPSQEQSRLEAVPMKSPAAPSSPFSKPPEPKPVVETPAPPPPEEPSPISPATPTDSPVSPEEETRPGLGPMIKKKMSKGDVKGMFFKAASAGGAFRPRPGGAGERLRLAATKAMAAEGPDGITGVVPAPPKPAPAPVPVEKEKEKPAPASSVEASPINEIPAVTVTASQSSQATTLVAGGEAKGPEEPKEQSEDAKNQSSRSIVVSNDIKYLTSLGVDPALLDNRSVEFSKWLDHFNWVPGEQMRSKNFDELRIDIDRELNKAQAGGWLARFKEEDDRVEGIKKGIDLSIQECEEMDNLLTLYSVELSTLSDDIAYIEAQGQGLQVQAANQKLLKKELESLLDTCAITTDDLEALKNTPLEDPDGLHDIETALVTLFKAMIKIDPSLGNPDTKKSEDDGADTAMGLDSDYGKMRIVQEKKEMYMAESKAFMRRLLLFTGDRFKEAFDQTRRAVEGPTSKKADPRNHEVGRDMLWMYSPLMLYARDVDLPTWDRIIHIYQETSLPVYKDEFRDALDRWKINSKSVGDDGDLLFTSIQSEKQQEGIAGAARKLTVKRSGTLARTFRGESKTSLVEKPTNTHGQPWEAFSGAMDDLMPLVEMEQNFMIDFFHATTLEHLDFPDAVAGFRPRERRGGDLKRHRMKEPDRELARRVTRAMETTFGFLEVEVQRFIDWVLASNPIQGIGVLATLEKKASDLGTSNQDFLMSVLQKLQGVLEGRFKRFVDEQIRAIEETKVKVKKRKGVAPFIRIFPNFSAAVENMMADVDSEQNVRKLVDREYERIIRSMFDSVKMIARDNPSVSAAANSSLPDPEDKEALNYHILMIENMNYFLDELSKSHGQSSGGTQEPDVLQQWKEKASSDLAEHMSMYLNAVMRRPLGKLLEHLENVEAQLASGKTASAVAAQPSNSKAIFNKVLGNYDAKEVRKGLEALRKRVEKHFGDSDEGSGGAGPGYSQQHEHTQGLVNRVLRECERFYTDVGSRIENITTNVYGGDVLFEWPRAEVKAAFSNLGRG
ncbi:hypothetical protein MCOR27_005857 [Pyricularia oryzae]|uniref:Exocyst complex component Sec3 PIP2-binding N-terminal domain-containing protein n=1 Tax=Pyricularia grisea TaxID=148305 RepID=A0ABQ8P294_PYRGI|nr:hypothetical protein MCOR01_004719 [Pyricularia oryzae]KAI6304974.1 hypothetical protein MCOR33_000093 [Pyricularia grisea]KAH9431422.1 hypothetical protein MCOR02_008713 [Pyricularia oryzae]KAI6256171.1 hypothetical protein MCOR19_007343 [Pyricularia oryzae]KAI6277882.1 hypothetical protein MCOR27_005857 [Pyricularia oryzae]